MAYIPEIAISKHGRRMGLDQNRALMVRDDLSGAILLGAGNSTTRVQTSDANKNFLSFYGESTATSGDARTAYFRLYFSGAGGSGEALRAYGIVNNVAAATGGTVNGAHITLGITGASGQVSGAGHAARFTLDLGAAVNPGGTLDVVQIDSNIASDATIPSKTPFLRFNNIGSAKLDYMIAVTNPSTTMFANAGTGANSAAVSTGGVASKVLKVQVDGTDYWLPLFSSNA